MKPLVHIVTTAFFLAMNLCAAPAFFTVPQPENGKEHEQALKVGHFFETADGAPAKEATEVALYHRNGKLHFSFRIHAFVLDPASNQRSFFKAEQTGHDSNVWSDDSVEIRISPAGKGAPYYICFNANGAILDTAYENGTRNKSWSAPFQVKNTLMNGAWLAECTLDLSQLGYPEQKQWDVNIQRFNQAKKSLSAWMPLTNGDHTSPENFIRLNLSGKPGKIQMPPSPAEINEQTGVPFEAAGLKEVSYVSELFSGDRIRARLRGKVTGQTFKVPVPRGKGENLNLRVSFYDAENNLLLRTIPYPYRQEAEEITADITSDKPFSLYLNGQLVRSKVKRLNGDAFPLVFGANLIALEPERGARISGSLKAAGELIPLDGTWKLGSGVPPAALKNQFDDTVWRNAVVEDNAVRIPETNGRIVLRKTLLFKATKFQPYPAGSWKVTQNDAYALYYDGSGIPGLPLPLLPDWKLRIAVPDELEFLGVTYPRYQLTAVQQGDLTKLLPSPELYRCRRLGNGQYEICANFSFSSMGTSSTWLQRIAAADKALLLFFRATGKAGTSTGIRFHAEAAGGAYREIPQFLPTDILPPLNGKAPEKLAIMLKASDGGMADAVCERSYFDTLKAAGVNEIFGPCYTDYLKKTGLRHFDFFNLTSDRYQYSPANKIIPSFFAAVPDAQGSWDGRKTGINAYTVAHDPAAAPYLEQIIEAYREFYPSLSGIWWDYEFKPFPTGIMRYPAFSEKSIRDFARRHQIKEPLTDLLIRRKYHDQWIDFSCEAVAGMFKSVGLAASKQGLPLYVYSGYQGDPVCKTAYNIDWALAGRYVDRAYCGYGLNRESIAMTRKSVKSGVLVGGLLKMGKSVQRDTAAAIVRMALECGGGVLLWYENRFDGSTLSQIASASRVLADAEDFILHGRRCDERINAAGDQKKHIAAFEKDGKFGIILLNETSEPMTFRFRVKDFSGVLYAGDKVQAQKKELVLKLPAGEAIFCRGEQKEKS